MVIAHSLRRMTLAVFSGLMIAAIFPGQGSQKPGMGRELHDALAEARAVFDAVTVASGRDAREICFEMDEETLRLTRNAQLALYTCGVAAYRALGKPAEVFAGHSVGEYAALAAAGILSVEDGARLVHRRGELMASVGSDRPGGMAAVLGLERAALETVCLEASVDGEVAVIANDNCPGQLVISGDKTAVERASTLATGAGAKRVLPLNVSGAFHSPLMDGPARLMREALDQATFLPGATVFANVTASAQQDPGVWPDLLERQLKSPVRWTESVQAMIASGVTTFIEYGVGEVLCGLIKRIDREATSMAVYDLASLEKAQG